MPDLHYENAKLAALYDQDSPWSADRDFYLSLAGDVPQDILDLGCGTGLLCNAYAEKGHRVTGVDPSFAMLDVGRQKKYGSSIEWVCASAQTYQSNKLFDLIIMTGHAFQVLLSDADILATFAIMKQHLKEGGRIAFESRNPEIDWAANWNYSLPLVLENGDTIQETRHFLSMDNGVMTFELRYPFPDQVLISKSMLRFLSRREIEDRLMSVGLCVDYVFGGWAHDDFNPRHSEEMIFVIR